MELKDYFRQGRELKGWGHRRVTEELEKRNISYSHTSIQRFEKGIIKKIPLKIINALTKVYNLDINKSYELAGITKDLENISEFNEEIELLKLKVYGVASAGNGSLNNEIYEDDFLVSKKDKISKESIVIEIKGDSMEPVLFDKDKILIDTSNSFEWQSLVNKIAVVEINQERYIKIVRSRDFKPEFHSLNNFYPPIRIKESDDVHFIGVLVKLLERDMKNIKF